MRTFILVTSLILHSVNAHSQIKKWEKGNAKMLQLEKRWDIKGAIEVGEQTLALVISKYGAMSLEGSIVMENLAANYIHLDEYRKAKPLLFTSITYELKTNGQTSALASMYTNLGNCYKKEKKYDSAEYYHKKSLALYENRLGNTHIYTVITKSNLGINFMAKGEVDKAITLLEEVLRYYQENKHLLYSAYTMRELGKAYNLLERTSEVEKYYRSAIRTFESGFTNDPSYAYALNEFGIFLVDKKRDSSGKEWIKKAISCIENTSWANSPGADELRKSANKYLTYK